MTVFLFWFLHSRLLLVDAATASAGTYNFTFFVGENCEGDTFGEPMVGEVGELYCMNFTEGVLSAKAEFTGLVDKKGRDMDGEFFFFFPL